MENVNTAQTAIETNKENVLLITPDLRCPKHNSIVNFGKKVAVKNKTVIEDTLLVLTVQSKESITRMHSQHILNLVLDL